MMKKKIYIAGCGGMLDEAFYLQFKEEFKIKCTDKDVNLKWLDYLDLGILKHIKFLLMLKSLIRIIYSITLHTEFTMVRNE